MKTVFCILFLVCEILFAQDKYLTKNGTISFEASVPSFEEVAAKNNLVTAIINIENGEIAALALINGFRFKNALMEEHFNENYAESNKYPKAIFQGKVENFVLDKATDKAEITGDLTFHGKTKTIANIPATFHKTGDLIKIEGAFNVMANDFGIEIPRIVKNKISEQVRVNFSFELHKK